MALASLPGTDDLIEYEARVNYVIPKYEDTVVCTYDLTKFGASAAMDALRTHPVVIIGGRSRRIVLCFSRSAAI